MVWPTIIVDAAMPSRLLISWFALWLVMPLGFLMPLGPPAAAAEVVQDLYRGQAIVTGQDNPSERERGVGEALIEVLIKVSGDMRIAADPRVPAILDQAFAGVTALDYEDRLAKKKLMDEQGTRERSYVLRVDFDPVRIGSMLAGLDRAPWGSLRPTVLVLLSVRDLAGSYVLTAKRDRGYSQRESLLSAGRKRGLPVVLPEGVADPDRNFLDADAIFKGPGQIEALRDMYAADHVLIGTMILTADGTWQTTWQLQGPDSNDAAWQIGPGSFDKALLSGIEGTAWRLASGKDQAEKRLR